MITNSINLCLTKSIEWMNEQNTSTEYKVTVTPNGVKNQVCVKNHHKRLGHTMKHTYGHSTKSLQNLQMKSAQQWYRYIYVCVCVCVCFGWLVVLLVGFLRENSIFLGGKNGGRTYWTFTIPFFWFFSPNKRKEKTPKHPTLHLCGVFSMPPTAFQDV